MRIGCHAVLFGPEIKTDTVRVLSSLHEAGAEGAEIGSRFFGMESSDELNSAMRETGMELSALHVISKLTQFLDEPDVIKGTLEKASQFLLTTTSRNIMMTGMVDSMDADDFGDARLLDPAALKAVFTKMNEIAGYIHNTYGVRVNYHNHSWEFKNGALIYKSLVEYAPEVYLGLDTGWASIYGYDPARIIRDNSSRVGYVHLRDYRRADVDACKNFMEIHDKAFCPVGEGEMDYPDLLDALKCVGDTGWGVIEYETGERDAARYKKAVEYIKGVLGR